MKKFGKCVLALGLMSLGPVAASGVIIGDFDFEILSEDERTVDVGISPEYDLDIVKDSLVIPPTVTIDGKDYTVTTVRESGFSPYSQKLDQRVRAKYMKLPSTVKYLREYSMPWDIEELEIETERFEEVEYAAFGGIKIKKFDFNKLPKDPAKIGSSVFEYSHIEEVDWPADIPIIRNYMFSESAVKKLTLPEGLQEIECEAFSHTHIDSISIPDNVCVGKWAFAPMWHTRDLKIGKGCTLMSSAFAGNVFIEKVTLPTGTVLGFDTFCTWCNVKELEIMGDLTVVDSWPLFHDDSKFWLREYPKVTPPQVADYVEPSLKVIYHSDEPVEYPYLEFPQNTYDEGCLYVEDGGEELARQRLPWSNFKYIRPMSEYVGIDVLDISQTDNVPTRVYTLNGIFMGESTAGLSPGVYVVRQGANVKKISIP